MALINNNYYKIDLNKCKIYGNVLILAFYCYKTKQDRDREKNINFDFYDLSKYEETFKKLSKSDFELDSTQKLINEYYFKSDINKFFNDKLYLDNNLNYDKEYYRNLFKSDAKTIKYLIYITNPIRLEFYCEKKINNYKGKLELPDLYAELKKYLDNPRDDL